MSLIAKVGSAFCQIRNKPSKIWQRLLNFCQRGEILPNLVTLVIGLNLVPARGKNTYADEGKSDDDEANQRGQPTAHPVAKRAEQVGSDKVWYGGRKEG